MNIKQWSLAWLLVGSAISASSAMADELIVNSGFEADSVETNSPFGWGVAENGALGSVVATNGNVSPISGYTTAGAASGSFYGLLDSFTPSAQVLYQTFTVGAVSSASLSFDFFYNDQSASGLIFNDAGLDYTAAGTFDANQHWRFDLLKSGTSLFSINPTDIVTTYSFGNANTSNPYTNFTYDLSSDLAAGGTFTLRFATVSNQGALQLGVDNVSLLVTPVPEVDSYAMLLAGLGVMGFVVRRRNAVK